MNSLCIFWLRRDIRINDNTGLYHALKNEKSVLPLFIFDNEILSDLTDNQDARVHFIHDALKEVNLQLNSFNSGLLVKTGTPIEVWRALIDEYPIAKVYTNRDYEPYAISRDGAVKDLLAKNKIEFITKKDHVIFEKGEIMKKDDSPYTVFTPYSRKWKEKLLSRMDHETTKSNFTNSFYLKSYPTLKYAHNFYQTKPLPFPSLADIGFEPSTVSFPSKEVSQKLIKNYGETRNFPAQDGTSRLGVHYRFGTISIREKARKATQLNETYLNELIWRDFYAMILANFPRVIGAPFRKKYEAVPWRYDEADFNTWKQGKTGYPLVDAGMRELLATGYMHNRVRMVVASFLTKHLLLDWRLGETWFAEKLLDFDLASNNGGWQWAAGCGTDAAPYFRIFNPTTQLKKFDPKLEYVKKWVPEYGTADYPQPMVDHKFARERCLKTYKEALATVQ